MHGNYVKSVSFKPDSSYRQYIQVCTFATELARILLFGFRSSSIDNSDNDVKLSLFRCRRACAMSMHGCSIGLPTLLSRNDFSTGWLGSKIKLYLELHSDL